MDSKELIKIVNYIDKKLRYTEPKKVFIKDNKVILESKERPNTIINNPYYVIYESNNIIELIEVLNSLKTIDELIPLIEY